MAHTFDALAYVKAKRAAQSTGFDALEFVKQKRAQRAATTQADATPSPYDKFQVPAGNPLVSAGINNAARPNAFADPQIDPNNYSPEIEQAAKSITPQEIADLRAYAKASGGNLDGQQDSDVALVAARMKLQPGGVMQRRGPTVTPQGSGVPASSPLGQMARAIPGVKQARDFAYGAAQGGISQPGSGIASMMGTGLGVAGFDNAAALFHEAANQINAQAPQGSGVPFKLGTVAGQMAPALSATVTGGATTPLVTSLLSASSFGSGVQEYRNTLLSRGEQPTPGGELAVGLGFAAVEYITERIGIDAAVRKVPGLGNSLKAFRTNPTPAAAMQFVNDMAPVMLANTGEELSAQGGQNLIAKAKYDPNRPITQGMVEAGLLGAAGGAMIAAPGAALNALGAGFNAYDARQRAQQKAQQPRQAPESGGAGGTQNTPVDTPQTPPNTTALDEAAALAEQRLNERYRAAPVGSPSPADQVASSRPEQDAGADTPQPPMRRVDRPATLRVKLDPNAQVPEQQPRRFTDRLTVPQRAPNAATPSTPTSERPASGPQAEGRVATGTTLDAGTSPSPVLPGAQPPASSGPTASQTGPVVGGATSASPQSTREPWQMTRGEFRDWSYTKEYQEARSAAEQADKDAENAVTAMEREIGVGSRSAMQGLSSVDGVSPQAFGLVQAADAMRQQNEFHAALEAMPEQFRKKYADAVAKWERAHARARSFEDFNTAQEMAKEYGLSNPSESPKRPNPPAKPDSSTQPQGGSRLLGTRNRDTEEMRRARQRVENRKFRAFDRRRVKKENTARKNINHGFSGKAAPAPITRAEAEVATQEDMERLGQQVVESALGEPYGQIAHHPLVHKYVRVNVADYRPVDPTKDVYTEHETKVKQVEIWLAAEWRARDQRDALLRTLKSAGYKKVTVNANENGLVVQFVPTNDDVISQPQGQAAATTNKERTNGEEEAPQAQVLNTGTAAPAPAQGAGAVSAEPFTRTDGTAKEAGTKRVEELRATFKTKRAGWHFAETDEGATLIHPTEDRVVRFKADQSNQRDRARTYAQAFADDNPVKTEQTAPGELKVQELKIGGEQPDDGVRVADKLAKTMTEQHAQNGYTTGVKGFGEKYAQLTDEQRRDLVKELVRRKLLPPVYAKMRKMSFTGFQIENHIANRLKELASDAKANREAFTESAGYKLAMGEQDASTAATAPQPAPAKVEEKKAVQAVTSFPISGPPSFREWRTTREAANSVRIIPNKVGAKFTEDQIATLVEWAKSQGLETSGKSLNGVRVTSPAGKNQRLELDKYGIAGVKTEQADQARADRDKADTERAASRKSEADAKASAKWIIDTFGDGNINDFNRVALSDFVEGPGTGERRFLVNARWEEGLRKLGAIRADGSVNWDRVRDAYRGSRQEAPAQPPKPIEVKPEPAQEPAPVEEPAPTANLSGLPDSYSPAKTYKRMTPRKGTDARTNLEQELERYKERRKVLWDDSERAAEDLSRFERTSTLKKNTKEYKQKHGEYLRKSTAAREAWREFIEKESKDSIRRSNKGVPSIGDMMVVLNLEDAADSSDPLIAVPARLRLATEWSYGTDSSRWNNRGVDDYNAARKWFDGYVADRMKDVEPTDGPGLLSKEQEAKAVEDAAKEAAQSLVDGSAPKDINTMMLGYLERERRTTFATHVSNAIDQIRNSFSNRNPELWSAVQKTGQDIGSPNRTTLSIVELAERLKRAQAIRDEADGATASLIAEGIGEIAEAINATPARRVGPSLEKMDTPLLARLHKWANVNPTSFKNEVQAVLLKRAGTYAKLKEMVEEQASMPFTKPESTRRKNRGPLVLTGGMLLGKTGVEKTPEAGDSPLEILKSVAALEREAAAVGISKKDAKALPARNINLLTLEGDNVVVRTKDATYKFVADRFGIDPGEFENGQAFLIDWRSIDRLDARRKELSKMKGKALDDLAESMDVRGKSTDRMILNIMQKESGLYPAFAANFDTSALDANAPEIGERLASAYPEDWNGSVLKLDAEANTPSSDVIQKLEKIIDRLRVRMEERAKARGYRLYSTILPIMHPLDIIDTSAWVAAHALKATIKGGRALTAFIDAKIAERFPGVQYDKRAVRKTVAAYLKNATTEQDIYDAWKSANARESKRRIAAVAGESPSPKAVKEAAATGAAERPDVAAKIIQAAKAAYRQGRAEGRREAEAAIPGLLGQIKRQKKQLLTLAEIERRGGKAEAEADQAVRDGIRKQVIQYAQTLPPRVRGKLVASIATATTPIKMTQTVRRLERELYRAIGRDSRSWFNKTLKPKKLLKSKGMTDKARNRLTAIRQESTNALGVLRSGDASLTAMRAAVATLATLQNEAGAILQTERAAYRQIEGERKFTAINIAQQATEDVKSAAKTKTTDDQEDYEANPAVRLSRSVMDIRNAVQMVTGKIGSQLESVLYKRFVKAENAMFEQQRELRAQVERACKAAGFKDAADASRVLSGRGGKGNTERVRATFGGKSVVITLGEALGLLGHASDPMTLALIHSEGGQPFQTIRGRLRSPVTPDPNDIDSLASQVDPDGKYRKFLEDIKAIMESTTDASWRVHYLLRGFEPVRVEKRWPRPRNMQANAETAVLPETASEMLNTFLENDGHFTHRVQTTGVPILLIDPITVVLDEISTATRTIHLAVPLRDAANVIYQPGLSRAIAARFGKSMFDSLRTHLMRMGRSSRVLGTPTARGMARINNWRAVSSLGLNPGTWAVTAISALRLLPMMGAQDFAAGIAGAKDVSMEDMMRKSGHAWERYEGSQASDRYSSVVGVDTESPTHGTDEMKAMLANIKAKDPGAAFANLQRIARMTMRVLNWFDGLVYRIAWAGLTARAKRLHPEWSTTQRERWVASKASAMIRESQQGSSPVDAAMGPERVKGTALSGITLFSSDALKSRNRIRRAYRKGKAAGTAALAAEVTSVVLGVVAKRAIWGLFSVSLAMMLGWDDEDEERLSKKYLAADRAGADAAAELANLVVPIIGQNIVRSIQNPWGAKFIDSPALSAIEQVAVQGYRAVKKSLDDDATAEEIGSAWARFVNGVTGATGVNPFEPWNNRVITEVDAANE